MTRRYDFKANDGNAVMPVADGQFFTDSMSVTPDEVDVYIAFYSDAEGTVPAIPTGGLITSHGEYLPGFFLAASSNPVTNATDVAPEATYIPSVIDGCTLRCRLTLSGVTGAAYMRAFAYKRG